MNVFSSNLHGCGDLTLAMVLTILLVLSTPSAQVPRDGGKEPTKSSSTIAKSQILQLSNQRNSDPTRAFTIFIKKQKFCSLRSQNFDFLLNKERILETFQSKAAERYRLFLRAKGRGEAIPSRLSKAEGYNFILDCKFIVSDLKL